jgi:hypothetical protein
MRPAFATRKSLLLRTGTYVAKFTDGVEKPLDSDRRSIELPPFSTPATLCETRPAIRAHDCEVRTTLPRARRAKDPLRDAECDNARGTFANNPVTDPCVISAILTRQATSCWRTFSLHRSKHLKRLPDPSVAEPSSHVAERV